MELGDDEDEGGDGSAAPLRVASVRPRVHGRDAVSNGGARRRARRIAQARSIATMNSV
jgi:hypothetical protein